MHFSANNLTSLTLPHHGILEAEVFDACYDLRCYAPPEDLKPYIVHLWAQRPRPNQPRFLPLEVQTGPNTYIFINHDRAYIHGIFSDRFRYQPHLYPVYAGVKFRPGGLRAFAHISMAKLSERTMPAQSMFPGIDDLVQNIDNLPDEGILTSLTSLLRERLQVPAPEFLLVTQAMRIIDQAADIPSLVQLQSELHMSDRAMRHLFQEHVGVPAKWVLMRKRFIATTHTATTAQLAWGNAAAQYGYSSQSHFTREFRRVTRVSPSAFQQTLAQLQEIASIAPI